MMKTTNRNYQQLSQRIALASITMHNFTDTRENVYPGGAGKPSPRLVEKSHPLMEVVRYGDNLICSEASI